MLLTTRQIDVEGRQIVKEALDAFVSGAGDFADSLIALVYRATGCETTLTFDRKAAALNGFSLLNVKR